MAKLRDNLRGPIGEFGSVLMLTLTVHREGSAESQYRECQEKRAVSELMRKLKRRGMVNSGRYFYVIEFHQDGYPHWHLLVDSSFVCKYKLQKLWGRGNCWVSSGPKGLRFKSNDHALNYVTKYVAKWERPFPGWVMDFPGNMRRFSCSRGLMPRKGPPRRSNAEGYGDRKRVRQTARERVGRCQTKTVTFQVVNGVCVFRQEWDIPFQDKLRSVSLATMRAIEKRRSASWGNCLESIQSRREILRAMSHSLSTPNLQTRRRKADFVRREQDRLNRQNANISARKAFVLRKLVRAGRESSPICDSSTQPPDLLGPDQQEGTHQGSQNRQTGPRRHDSGQNTTPGPVNAVYGNP